MPGLLVLTLALTAGAVGAAPLRVAVVPASQEALRASGMASFARGILSQQLACHPDLVLVEHERIDQVLQEASSPQGGPQQAGPASTSRMCELGDRLAVKTLYLVDVQCVYPDYSAIVRVVDVASGQILHVEDAQLGAHLEQARQETEQYIQRQIERISARELPPQDSNADDESAPSDQ